MMAHTVVNIFLFHLVSKKYRDNNYVGFKS